MPSLRVPLAVAALSWKPGLSCEQVYSILLDVFFLFLKAELERFHALCLFPDDYNSQGRAELGQAEARNFFWVFCVGSRGPITWAFFCDFPRHVTELDGKRSNRNLNSCPYGMLTLQAAALSALPQHCPLSGSSYSLGFSPSSHPLSQFIAEFKRQIPALRTEVRALQAEMWNPREIVFEDILLRRPK